MRYQGENSLLFSTDPEKNVTVILGDNTFGKTTIAQAFRWGLYGEVSTTNYTNKKDVVLLNNEVIAGMTVQSREDVKVEIMVENEKDTYTFIRKQSFRKKTENPYDLSVIPITESRLSMIISNENRASGLISNDGNPKEKMKPGCVQEAISNMFPQKLSNYFFFDGERWNKSKDKTSEIKQSINTILGVSSLIKMKEHFKDGNDSYRTSVLKKLRGDIKGSSQEVKSKKDQIAEKEKNLEEWKIKKSQYMDDIKASEQNKDKLEKILNDSASEEQKLSEIKSLRISIESNTKHMENYYSDLIGYFSNIDKLLTAELLSSVNQILEQVDMEGIDIPGVTSDTIDWLLNEGKCLCGEEFSEGDPHYTALLKLREEVYPKKIGGPAKALRAQLIQWGKDTESLVDHLNKKAVDFEITANSIEDDEETLAEKERQIDKKRNLGEVRNQYNLVKKQHDDSIKGMTQADMRIEGLTSEINSLTKDLQRLEDQDKDNAIIYKAIEYVEAMYAQAAKWVTAKEKPTVVELNEIIQENFDKMFDSKDKYAKMEDDYKIHMYYRSIGGYSDYEEENLSNGEMIAVNFVYIVSILELAKKRKSKEETKEAILSLPLVLDAPFSNLSSDNTGLVAQKLPEFAEQVIIFMLDKDWEASGLQEYTLPDYCYHVSRDFADNSSTIEKIGGNF